MTEQVAGMIAIGIIAFMLGVMFGIGSERKRKSQQE